MARRIKINVMPDRQADKRSCVASSTVGSVSPALPNECILLMGDDVAPHRDIEMINGWRWLWNGIRDRDLLNPDVSPVSNGPLYSAAPIDSLTEYNRLTSWDSVVGITSEMVGIGIGINVFALRGTQMVESAFTLLREFYREYKGHYPV